MSVLPFVGANQKKAAGTLRRPRHRIGSQLSQVLTAYRLFATGARLLTQPSIIDGVLKRGWLVRRRFMVYFVSLSEV